MRRSARSLPVFLILLLASLLSNGCWDTETHSLYDPGAADRAAPSISSISPAATAMAGMDTIVLQGLNFHPNLSDNNIFFNASAATPLSATPTQLVLLAPLEVGDSIAIRVSVTGSIMFSNTIAYALQAGVASFGDLAAATNIAPAELASAIAVDAAGELYVAEAYGPSDGGILRFDSSGVRSVYAPTTTGVAFWSSLKMGPGGVLFAGRNFRAVYQFAAGGGGSATAWVVFPVGISITDFDFDQDGNLWGGGNNSNLYRVEPNKTITSYPFVGNVRSMRVYEGYLYFVVWSVDAKKIWRAQISAGGLGTPEVYFDFSAAYPDDSPLAITFASDGTLFIGTNASGGLVIVHPDLSYSTPYAAYSDLFGTGIGAFAWGDSNTLYAATSDGLLIGFVARGKTTAPYHGSTL